jgi:hypothetical protein
MTPSATVRMVAVDSLASASPLATDDENGRGDPLPAAGPAGEPAMERVHRDRQDGRPGRQRQERRKDLVAQNGQGGDQTGANQDIQQRG